MADNKLPQGLKTAFLLRSMIPDKEIPEDEYLAQKASEYLKSLWQTDTKDGVVGAPAMKATAEQQRKATAEQQRKA